MKTFRLIIMLPLMKLGHCKMEPFVVKGEEVDIENFPYVAYLSINCTSNEQLYMCGSSILNQYLLLTAAHCVYDCQVPKLRVFVGHGTKRKGAPATVTRAYTHEKYDPETLYGDICLLKSETALEFNLTVSRVAIMKKPPYNEVGKVAGWGMAYDIIRKSNSLLGLTQYYISSKKNCSRTLNVEKIEDGSFCASSRNGSHLAHGDSGSALVVRGYIQIGIVSYRMRQVDDKNQNIVVYTDTGYFYEWIRENAKKLCDSY